MQETLYNFEKFSTPLDWLVILGTVFLIVIGLALLIFLRSPKPFYFVIASAVAPLLGGLLSTFLKYQSLNRALESMGRIAVEAVARGKAEALIITYFGIIGAIIIALIGLLGVVLKKKRSAAQANA